MKADQIDAALAAIPQRDERHVAPIGGVLASVLPTPAEVASWRAADEDRQDREHQHELEQQERRERARAEHDKRRKELIAELSPRIESKLLSRIRSTPTFSALLLGPTGCGKSSAARLLWGLAPRGALNTKSPPYQLRAVDLATAERRHGLGDGFAPELVRARHAAALIIDDVGQEREVAALFDVLDHRYWNRLPVIVTTGHTRSELQAHIGAAGVRRIVEQHAGYPMLIVDCHDVRGTGGLRG